MRLAEREAPHRNAVALYILVLQSSLGEQSIMLYAGYDRVQPELEYLVLKGSVSQDFRPPVFFMIRTHLGP